ncbi:MAG: glycosyltransferase family 4 protein [Gammaproteobacteria bacterium]|nr:glycosyltransferase family 4 protein [Gammaproteobacteria bacterium]
MDNHSESGNHPENKVLNSIVLIGNHMPRLCGIATFTTHLLDSIALKAAHTDCWAVAMSDRPEGYDYPPQVRLEINQDHLRDYSMVADQLNLNQIDVVCVQHEYGIFGGQRGSFILELLSDLKMPIVTTLHTILKNPGNRERHIIKQLADLSDRLVVMSERSVEFLRDIYEVDAEKIVLIHHGIPDVPLLESATYKDKFGVSGKKVMLTLGLLSPGKGIEVVIDALPEILKIHPDVIYMVVGATHPHLQAEQGEDYRIGLHLHAKKLGVEDHVIFHNHFVTDEDLLEFVGASDIYITPYLNEAQIISGTLAYALGMGKAIISTPYWHAEELLEDGRGRLIPFRDHAQLASDVIDLLDNPDELRLIQRKAYEYGRQMIWSNVASRYIETFEQSRQHRLRKSVPGFGLGPLGLRQQSLPEIKLDHLLRMTDGVGMLQHSKYTVPDREHGYCVDDNARALIVVVTAQNFQPRDVSLNELASVYLSFIDHAFNSDTGLFRNFMSYERHWIEEQGSEDSHGRALWGLGVAVALGRNEGQVNHAADLFQRALPAVEHFNSPRAVAFTIIGIHAYLKSNRESSQIENTCRILSERLMQWLRNDASGDWLWCEETLTYDNARLPQALLLSGQWLENDEMINTALSTLDWLKKIQHDDLDRYFSAIGNHGWYTRGGNKAQFDQQPIEAAAMIDACIDAFKLTRNEEWITYAYRCLNWYQGENELHLSLYDHATGGCRDGLMSHGVNENQGAESTLCWLMALLAIYKHRGRGEIKRVDEKNLAQ